MSGEIPGRIGGFSGDLALYQEQLDVGHSEAPRRLFEQAAPARDDRDLSGDFLGFLRQVNPGPAP